MVKYICTICRKEYDTLEESQKCLHKCNATLRDGKDHLGDLVILHDGFELKEVSFKTEKEAREFYDNLLDNMETKYVGINLYDEWIVGWKKQVGD